MYQHGRRTQESTSELTGIHAVASGRRQLQCPCRAALQINEVGRHPGDLEIAADVLTLGRMVHFLAAAARAAIVALTCPKCGLVQVRARRKAAHRYACKACGHRFWADEGEPRA